MADDTLLDRFKTLRHRPRVEPWWSAACRIGRFFLLSLRRTHEDGMVLTSSALAYVTILSLIPLLAAFSFVGARVFSRYQEQSLEVFVQVLPYHEATVTEKLAEFLDRAQSLSGWGIVTFFATALFAFGTVEEAINRIWSVSRRRPWRVRLFSFGLLVFWGPLLLGAMLSSLFILEQRRTGFLAAVLEESVLLNVAPFVAAIVGLTLLYWLLPYTRVVFQAALVGGLTAAILLELLRQGFGLYVSLLKNPSSIYGSFAFALFFAISIQLTWAIVLYGSEVSYCVQHYGALSRGLAHQTPLQGRWIGLAATSALARQLDLGEPVTREDALADRLLIAPDQLERVLQPLLDAKILRPTEGRERGYLLARPPHKIRVEEVLAAYDARSHRVFEPLGAQLQATLDVLAARVEELRGESLGKATLANLLES